MIIAQNNMTLLLQVILSPIESVGYTYRVLIPEDTPLEFQRILDLKVCSYAMHFQMIENHLHDFFVGRISFI